MAELIVILSVCMVFIQQNTDSAKIVGSYLACGENVDTEEKIVHGAEARLLKVGAADINPTSRLLKK